MSPQQRKRRGFSQLRSKRIVLKNGVTMDRHCLRRTILALLALTVACLVCLIPGLTYTAEQDEEAEEAVIQKLLTLHARLDQMKMRVQERIFIPHSPFIFGLWKEAKPRLLWEIVRGAAPDVVALQEEMKRAIELGRELEPMLRKSAGAEGGPGRLQLRGSTEGGR